MEVTISALRAGLVSWVRRAHDGEEIIVTDRGIPVARINPVDSAPLLERLTRDGVLSKPRGPRPVAHKSTRVNTNSSVADLVGDDRR